MGFQITGLDLVQKNLSAKRELALQATTKALEVIGQQGVTFAKGNTPVLSGRLRGSMGYTIAGKVEMAENDPLGVNTDKNTVIIGTNVIYGPSVEYRSQTDSKGFMQRSFNQLRKVANQIAAQTIKKEVG